MSIDLSLARVQKLFSLLPEYTRPTIHVAGTNGKGSVTAILSSIFTSSHISVGRFNSPHLIHVWDAIFINGHSVSQDTYNIVRGQVESVNNAESIGASSFEVMTATAAQIFEQARVDIAIFEVGLGGRLDATNVLPDSVIVASAITSIGLDHQLFLGNTLAVIAREKAGIARKGNPCIIGAQIHSEVHDAVQEVVSAVGGILVNVSDVTLRTSDSTSQKFSTRCQSVAAHFPPWNTTLELELPLLGAHQLQNLAVVLTILAVLIQGRVGTPLEAILDRVSPSTIFTGVLQTKWPGRLESVKFPDPPLNLLVDGAHNAASAESLRSYLLSTSPRGKTTGTRPPRTFILGLSHSPPKTPLEVLGPLLQPGDNVGLVSFTEVEDMPWVKNVPLRDLEDVGHSLVKDGQVISFELQTSDTPLAPLKRALLWAAEMSKGEEVVVAGSLYLVADLHRLVKAPV